MMTHRVGFFVIILIYLFSMLRPGVERTVFFARPTLSEEDTSVSRGFVGQGLKHNGPPPLYPFPNNSMSEEHKLSSSPRHRTRISNVGS